MPDLQTALTTAIKHQVLTTTINEWEEEEQQTMQAATQTQAPSMQTKIVSIPSPTLTGNLSKDIFVYIKENPGCLRSDVRQTFTASGFNESSIGSLITQMIRSKMVSINEVGNLEAKRVYYKPLVSGAKRKEMNKKLGTARDKPKAAKPKAQGIAALAPEPTQNTDKGREALDRVLAKPVREARAVYDALCILRDLDVGDARYMYAELHKLFGG
jgi:hypothetical protein